jgi:hypothetical protein
LPPKNDVVIEGPTDLFKHEANWYAFLILTNGFSQVTAATDSWKTYCPGTVNESYQRLLGKRPEQKGSKHSVSEHSQD